MSFIKNLFGPKKEESIVLIDIGARAITGAYAHYAEGKPPVLVYERSQPVEFREGEQQEKSVLRTLKTLGETLIREGAPELMRATGRGSAQSILVAIDAPWQKISVRTEYLEEKKPFLFTKRLAATVLEKTRVKPPGKVFVDESIIGTILNGYVTSDPYGKEAHRAELVILTSIIDEFVAKNIVSTLRSVYHTRQIIPIAGSSLRYQAVRRVFPHERDALIIDATGPLTSIALIRKNLFMSILQIPDATASVDKWIQCISQELVGVAQRYPLPRTIFLIAREPDILELQKALAAASFGELWLSESQPTVVPVLSSHITGMVHQASVGTPDLLMLLMALYWRLRDPAQ